MSFENDDRRVRPKRVRSPDTTRAVQPRSSEEQEIARRVELDLGSLPTPAQIAIFSRLGFRELRNVCQSSTLAALRLCGIVDDSLSDVDESTPMYEVFRNLLRRDFGISATPALGAAPAAPLRALVAESLEVLVPISATSTFREPLTALQTLRLFRNLYLRLYNSVQKPLQLYQAMGARNMSVQWLHYSHGGSVLVGIKERYTTHYAIVSIVSLYAALSQGGTADELLREQYGPLIYLTSVTASCYRALFMVPDAGVYRSNLLYDGSIVMLGGGEYESAAMFPEETAFDAVYVFLDAGLLSFSITAVLAPFESTHWPNINSWFNLRIRARRSADRTKALLVVESRDVSLLFHVIDRNTAVLLHRFEWPARTYQLAVTEHTDLALLSIETEGFDDLPKPVEGIRVRLLAEPRFHWMLDLDSLMRVSLMLATRHNIHTRLGSYRLGSTRATRFFVIFLQEHARDEQGLTRQWLASECVVLKIDCGRDGAPRSTLGYRFTLPPGDAEVGAVIDDSVLSITTQQVGAVGRLVLLDTVTGDKTTLMRHNRYSWLNQGVIDHDWTTHPLSVLTRDFDNSAGAASSVDSAQHERLVGRQISPD